MDWCKCNGIWDISKKIPKSQIQESTISTQDIEKQLEQIFQKLNEKKTITSDLLKNISIEIIMQHELYSTLSKSEKSTLVELFKAENTNTVAYLVCKNCNNYVKMSKTILISTKENYEIGSGSQYVDQSTYKYNPYSSTLRATRYYNCPNKSCASHTDITKKKAVMDRENIGTATIYTCCTCNTYWPVSQ
jgi:hypothetical protein